jgi:hypothetical protein
VTRKVNYTILIIWISHLVRKHDLKKRILAKWSKVPFLQILGGFPNDRFICSA